MIELFCVGPAVVGRNAHLGQDNRGTNRLALFNHGGQVLTGHLDRQSAQPVVTPEFQQNHSRLVLFKQPGKARQTTLGGVAGDA